MLKIRVLGRGLIPRGFGLAPKKDPFLADLTLITTILGTPGLKVEYIHPETNNAIPLTNENCQRVYNSYGNTVTVTKNVIVKSEENEGQEQTPDKTLSTTQNSPSDVNVNMMITNNPKDIRSPMYKGSESEGQTTLPSVQETLRSEELTTAAMTGKSSQHLIPIQKKDEVSSTNENKDKQFDNGHPTNNGNKNVEKNKDFNDKK